MLELFRKNQFFYYIFMLLYLAVVASPLFMNSFELYDDSGGLLYNLIKPHIEGKLHLFKILILILSLVQVLILNRMVGINRISASNSLFPGLFFILFTFYIPEFIGVTPQFFANYFMVLVLYNVMDIDLRKKRPLKIFNMGMYTSIASLFFPGYILFLVVALFAIEFMVSMKWKDIILLLIGFMLPFYVTGGMMYLFDDFGTYLEYFRNGQFFDFLPTIYDSATDFVKIALFGILVLLTFGNSTGLKNEIHITNRKKLSLIFAYQVGAIIIMFISNPSGLSNLQIIVPYLAVLIACSMLILKNFQMAEIIHLILLSGLITFHFLLRQYIL